MKFVNPQVKNCSSENSCAKLNIHKANNYNSDALYATKCKQHKKNGNSYSRAGSITETFAKPSSYAHS